MYITDLKNEFYDYLTGKHIVIIVHYDVDALCTCKIFQSLIRYEGIQYTLIPVLGLQDLKKAYSENRDGVKCFVLINCGGTIDIVEELDPLEDSVFFVLDSHRPTDVCNIYSNGQVRLLWSSEEDQGVPEFDDIFREDDEENEDDENQHVSDEENESEGRAAKRRRLGEEEILKRRERRLWEDKRNKLMFEYSQYSYYAKASAITFYELAHQLAKNTKENLWLAIVALTEQILLGKIESAQYTISAGSLQLEVDRWEKRTFTKDIASSVKISSEQDLKLALYRHWTVEQSLRCSLFTTSRLKLSTRKGERRLQELLAEMGLPLAQSKQKFGSMDLIYRQEFQSSLLKCSEKFALDNITFRSFVVQYSYRNKFSASDMVYIVLSILEQAPRSKQIDECFNEALDSLTRTCSPELFTTGLDRARTMFETCFKVTKAALDQKKIFSAGPFLYYFIQPSYSDWYLFAHPHVLLILAKYIQECYCERHKTRNSTSMPLLVSGPFDASAETSILVGLPPLCENSPKNFFGKAFEQAAERSNARVNLDFFDTSYVQVKSDDRTKFLDSLTALLS